MSMTKIKPSTLLSAAVLPVLAAMYVCFSPRVARRCYQTSIFGVNTTRFNKLAMQEFPHESHQTSLKLGDDFLNVFHFPASGRYTALINVGRNTCVSDFLGPIKLFLSLGIGVVIYDYRGFGSRAKLPISLRSMAEDASAVLSYMINDLRLQPRKIFIVGVSLGSGIATYLCEIAKEPLAGLIHFTPYTSMLEQGKKMFPLLSVFPDWLCLRSGEPTMRNLPFLKQAHPPYLGVFALEDEIMTSDWVVPAFETQVSEPRLIVQLASASHNTWLETCSDRCTKAIRQYQDMLDTYWVGR
jgi:hypothetical protein